MIELKNISAGYGKKNVIENVSFEIPGGRLISLVGANGSGKSTLLKTAAGIIGASGGGIFIDGTNAGKMTRRDIAKKVAYLAQGKSVSGMTVGQMVLHGRFPHLGYPRRYGAGDIETAGRAMAQLGIEDLAERPLAELSGGMRQKAYIAMALAQDTDYILLDEPTTYLDIAGQLELMRTLRRLADAGKGILTVMHDLPLAFGFSDETAVLTEGGIAVCGKPEEVCQSGMIERVFGTELRYSAGEKCYYYRYSR